MAEDTSERNHTTHEQTIALIPSHEALETYSEVVAGEAALPDNDEAKTTSTGLPIRRDEIDNSNLHYEGNVCVYTDPVTMHQYVWDSNKNEWVLRSDGLIPLEEGSLEMFEENALKPGSEVHNNTNPETGRRSSPNRDKTSRNVYEFDGEAYCYKDLKTGVTYKFDNGRQLWVVKHRGESHADNEECDENDDKVIKQDMSSGTYGYEGGTHTYTDATDGTVYIWDREKNAWFPKVDEDFLAHYQMNYGFTDTSTATLAKKEADNGDKEGSTDEQLGVKRKAGPQEPSWFEMDDEHNTKVYVSNFPLDITDQEFVDVMQKCGLVMKDAETGKMKVKLYTEPGTSQLKGDGLCSYIKVESVDLALKLLDGYELRGHTLHVERAKFQMKGNYDPNLKPKKRKKKEKEKLKKIQEKLFDWRPDKLRGERSKHERVVIVKNLFDPAIFDKDVSLLLEYQQDLREECSKCGDVRRVNIYDRHPEGVAQITFREPEEADACVTLLNGRWFGQRKITAETWDGKTKYKIAETDSQAQQRLQKWDKFLVSGKAAAGHTAGENKMKTNDTEENVDAYVKMPEKKSEEDVDKYIEVNKESEVEKSEKCSVEGTSSGPTIEEDRSSAGSSDDTEGYRSENEENGEGSMAVESGQSVN